MPAVGQRVVLSERSFAGDVASVTREDGLIVVRASMVDLEEIFDTYYAVSVVDFENDGSAPSASSRQNAPRKVEENIKLPTIELKMNEDLINFFLPGDGELPDAVKASYVAQVQPEFKVKASLVVNNGKHANVSLVGDFHCMQQFDFNGKAEYSKDLYNKTRDVIDQPIGETFLFFYNRWGLVFKAAVELAVKMTWQQNFRATFDWSYESKAKKQKMPTASFKRTSADFEPEGTLKGSLFLGPFTEIGIKFVCTELAKACLRAEGGVELVGDFVLNNKNAEGASNETKLYEMLKDSKIELNAAGNTSVQLSFVEVEQGFDLPLSGSHNLLTRYLVPEFRNTSLEQRYGAPTSAVGSVSMTKRDLIAPVEVGMQLFDKDGVPVSEWKSPNKYVSGTRTIEHQFEGLDGEEMYKLRPTVKFLFWDMLANPEAPIERDPFPVFIAGFEQTGSHYSKQQGYEYEGRNYFYKFNATTTVDLNPEAKNVKDWGYIYHDIYGVDKKISCANLGSNPYADSRYAYYYNESDRTVELSPYVQYDDGNDILVGKRKSYYVEYTLPVRILSFNQTSSQYSKEQDFVYEGKRYSYRFNAVATVELDEEETNVRDWGYIYHDIYGVDKKISCANLGDNPYIDTRFAYYYNEPRRTVKLTPYIQYEGEEVTIGRMTSYDLEHVVYEHYCPDDNHPHMIDLGLPSGTKWACCNVGAYMPHEYGNYYAWGETSPKSEYTFATYEFCVPADNYYGKDYKEMDDIAGTSFDAATVNWGGEWRMPTKDQLIELCYNTYFIGATLNGVNGGRFIGVNGASIFLPLAGSCNFINDVYKAGTEGFYWTSTASISKCDACRLEFGMYTWGAAPGWWRYFGLSVRPVASK